MKFVRTRLTTIRAADFRINRSGLWTFARIGVALSLAGLVLTQIQFGDLLKLWQRISFPWLIGSLVAFYISIWAMARRYWILLDRKILFRDLLSLTVIQTVIGSLIATSAGAATTIALLHGKHQVRLSGGVALFVAARVLDLFLLLLMLGLSSWILWSQIEPLHGLIIILLCGLGIIALFVLFLVVARDRWSRVIISLARKIPCARVPLVARAVDLLEALSSTDWNYLRVSLGALVGYTLLMFGVMVASAYCMLAFFSVSISLWIIVFMMTLSLLVALVPIQIFGGLGVQDITNLYLYALFGFDRSEMAAVVIGMRVLFYFLNLALLIHLPIEILLERGSLRKSRASISEQSKF